MLAMARTYFQSRLRSLGGAALLVGLCGLAPQAPAQSATAADGTDATNVAAGAASPDAARTIEDLVRDLASSDFATREGATKALAAREDLSQKALEAQVGRADLSPEQRGRLIMASRDRFVRSPRAAMGVQFVNDMMMSNRAKIALTFKGFPAHELRELQAGDEIVAINGREPDPSIARLIFRPIIIASEPGDVLHVKIMRDGKIIEQDVHVGKFENLSGQPGAGQQSGSPVAELDSAWEARSEKYPMAGGRDATGTSAAISPGMNIDDWTKAAQSPQAVVERSRSISESVLGPSVAAGGQTPETLPVGKGSVVGNDDNPNWANINGKPIWVGRTPERAAPPVAIRPGSRQRASTAGFAGQFPAGGVDPMQDSLDMVMIQRDQMKKLALAERAVAGDPAQPEAVRAKAKVEMQLYEMQLQALDIQHNQIRMMMQQRLMPRR